MKCTELLESGAGELEIQTFLVDSGLLPVTAHIHRTPRDLAKELAFLSGLTLISLLKQLMIERLSSCGSQRQR